jgi:septal ring factor EnvC (AmiA/AmiB activator)
MKRADDDSTSDAGRRPDLTAMAFSMRAAEDGREVKGKGDEEKLSVFWRVFGGTILSICALVAVTLYNNTSTTLTELRSAVDRANEARAAAVNDLRVELAKAAEARAAAINDLRTDMAKASEARAELVRKDEVQTKVTTIYDRIQALQTQNNAQNATLTSQKTELDGLKERAAKVGTDLDAARKDFAVALDGLRKDQALTTDALKKDVAAMEGFRERLATVCGDFKAVRDDVGKLQKDSDRNAAYDLERKANRDAQYKQFDEAIKALQAGVQDCREKMARLEGHIAPPAVTPAGGTAPKKSAPADDGK